MDLEIDIEKDMLNEPQDNEVRSIEQIINNKRQLLEENMNQSKSEVEAPTNSSRKSTKCLRFGIDTILDAQPDVKTKFGCDVIKHGKCDVIGNDQRLKEKLYVYNGCQDNFNVNEEIKTESEDGENINIARNGAATCKLNMTRKLERVSTDFTTSLESYVHFPLSLHALRSNGVSFGGQRSALHGNGWSSALISDFRKERFSSVRRVGHPYQNRTPPKRKKPRTSFTRVQIIELEKRFERQKYLASTERSALAKSLKMSDSQVKTWFQNRRTKWRRQTAEERELERQAASRLLLSLQTDPNRKPPLMLSPDRMCLSQLQRLQESRTLDA